MSQVDGSCQPTFPGSAIVTDILTNLLSLIIFPIGNPCGDNLNSVQTGCVVEDKAQKSPLFWRCSGGL